MKKLIIAILALSAVITSLAGCRENGNKQTSEGTVSSQEKADPTEEEKPADNKYAEIAIGDQIKTEFAEMTIDEAGIKPNIRTSIKTGNITYTSGPSEEAGYQFAYIRGTVKNIAKTELSSPKIFLEANIDGYEYTSRNADIIETNGNSTYNLAPLSTYTYTLYVKIPDELATKHDSCVVNIGFGDEFDAPINSKIKELKYAYTMSL